MKKVWMIAALFGAMALAPVTATYADGSGVNKESQNYSIFQGKVTAINAANATITITDKNGASQTFTIPANAKVKVNGEESNLAAIAVDMYGGVKMKDGAIIMVKAYTPGTKDKPKS